MTNRILNDELARELYKDHTVGGWNIAQCAKFYGISTRTVRRELNRIKEDMDRGRYANGNLKDRKKPKESKLKPCGTNAAYQRHKRKGEYPCSLCLEAHYLEGVKPYKEKKSE